MRNKVSRILAAVAIVAGIGVGLVSADVPAEYKGKPYKDKAQAVPGKIMLAYYDEGGEGVAYHEPRPLKVGNFRNKEGVNCSAASHDQFADGKKIPGDHHYVGWTGPGEWLSYTVDVDKVGVYTVNIAASSHKNEEEELSLSINGGAKSTFKLEETGDYHRYKLFSNVAEVKLEKGLQVVKLTIEKQQHASNLYYLEFVAKTTEPATKDQGK